MNARSYLDHNATSPLRPAVMRAMSAAWAEPANASSVHAEGRRARSLVETARAQVAALVGAEPDRVVFTSGGTEADNLALNGLGPRRVLASAVEHVAVLEGASGVERLAVDADGAVRIDAFDRQMAEERGPVLVAIQAANNETGVLQPVAELAALARTHGALLHCDAVQAAGRVRLDIGECGAASLALSAHKLGGPVGVGALVLADGVELDRRLVAGGAQERGRRGGTENVAGIVGFGVAAEIAARDVDAEAARLSALRDGLEDRLRELASEIVVFGAGRARLPNTSCFALPGLKAETALIALDLAGLAVSSGAACSSGKVGRSHVLDAMGVSPGLASGAIRVSLGWSTTGADLVRLVGAFETLVRRLYTARIGRAA